MEKLVFEYPGVQVIQSSTSKPLIVFGAAASEIELWAGIPQKKSFEPDGSESSGFQRTENRKRLEQLKKFYTNPSNVVQNSLICGLKKIEGGNVDFKTEDGISGVLTITFPDLYNARLEELFSLLRSSLESRIGTKTYSVDEKLLATLKSKLFESEGITDSTIEVDEDEIINELETDDGIESAIFEESHLEQFLADVAIRHELLKELSDNTDIQNANEFLGFERNAILSFLLPITLVDGQHRLKGAMLAARSMLETEEVILEIAESIDKGIDPETVEKELLHKYSRKLPVSLLMEDDPKEQVFQFVVINQKATPIGKSLLGTIISTSLTDIEMENVSGRLKESGIVLEEARAITWAARNPESPFYGLVDRGIQTEKKDLLQWNVMGSLIQIFKELRGGCLFHVKVDYSKRWKEKYLTSSEIINTTDAKEAFYEWSKLDGVWRDFFVAFWSKVKLEFADEANSEKPNYWGRTRNSNIFNKISLTILAADFFKYLVSAKKSINNINEIEELVDDWLEDVNRDYFDRDWQTKGVKKDSTGIRAKWSEIWSDYRDNPEQLPQIRSYRIVKK